MARRIDRSRPESTFVPGDAQLVFSTTYGSEGVLAHLTDMNSELTLSSERIEGDSDESILKTYKILLDEAFDAMYGPHS